MVFASRIVSGYANAYSTAQTAVLRCLGADFLPGEKERPNAETHIHEPYCRRRDGAGFQTLGAAEEQERRARWSIPIRRWK